MRRILLIWLALVVPSLALAIGEQYGRITGVVYSPDGATLPGVKLTLSSKSLIGGARKLVSAEDGSFTFNTLAPGAYELKVTGPGFKSYTKSGIPISAGKTASLFIAMEIADGTEDPAIDDKPALPVIGDGFTTSGFPISAELICDVPMALLPPSITAEDLEKLPKQGQRLEEFLLQMPSAKKNNGTLLVSGTAPTILIDGQLPPPPSRRAAGK